MEMEKVNSINDYLAMHTGWENELNTLQNIIAKTELEATIKWGAPAYTLNGKNVLGLLAFKSYVGIWFHQGVFLNDDAKVLMNAQEGKTQALRQWRFQSSDDIDESLVLSYIQEAIVNQKEGKEFKPRKKPLILPEELKEFLTQDAELSLCFSSLPLSKRKEYATYLSEAKRDQTKQDRLSRIRPLILNKKGLNDQYK